MRGPARSGLHDPGTLSGGFETLREFQRETGPDGRNAEMDDFLARLDRVLEVAQGRDRRRAASFDTVRQAAALVAGLIGATPGPRTR